MSIVILVLGIVCRLWICLLWIIVEKVSFWIDMIVIEYN